MNRLWAVLREISWTAVLSVASVVGVIALAVFGAPLGVVIAVGSASIALAVLNLKA
jgi:hypothetical protein